MIFMVPQGFQFSFLDYHGFHGSPDRRSENLRHPVTPWWRHVLPDCYLYILSFGALKAWIWRPEGLDAGCSQDWSRLECVAAGSGEGLEEVLTRLTLQVVGEFWAHRKVWLHIIFSFRWMFVTGLVLLPVWIQIHN